MKKITQFLLTSITISSVLLHSGFLFAGTFEQGLVYYEKSNYQKAREIWQPLASQGDSRAQYNLALTWKKEKQPKKASEYLAMSRAEGLVDGYLLTIPKESTDKQLVSISKKDSKTSSDKIPQTTVDESEAWLLQQNKSSYTLQLVTTRSLKHAEKMQLDLKNNEQLEQRDKLYIQKVYSINKKEDGSQTKSIRYILLYGVFDSYPLAKTEAEKLPESLQKSNPWIRQLGVLQSIVSNKDL